MSKERSGAAAGLAGELTRTGHRLVQRVYYEDTDFSGFVYHARYLHFLERGRTDYLRLLGVDQRSMVGSQGLVFVVRRMEIDFRAPARMDDVLDVWTSAAGSGGARLQLEQRIACEGALLIEATVEVALVDGTGRPRRMPASLRDRLAVA